MTKGEFFSVGRRWIQRRGQEAPRCQAQQPSPATISNLLVWSQPTNSINQGRDSEMCSHMSTPKIKQSWGSWSWIRVDDETERERWNEFPNFSFWCFWYCWVIALPPVHLKAKLEVGRDRGKWIKCIYPDSVWRGICTQFEITPQLKPLVQPDIPEMKRNKPTLTSCLMKGTVLDLIYIQIHIASFTNQKWYIKVKHAYYSMPMN